MTQECLVLWVPANDLLAKASFDLSKAAKNLFLDAKLSSKGSPTHAWDGKIDLSLQATHQTDSKSETSLKT